MSPLTPHSAPRMSLGSGPITSCLKFWNNRTTPSITTKILSQTVDFLNFKSHYFRHLLKEPHWLQDEVYTGEPGIQDSAHRARASDSERGDTREDQGSPRWVCR